MATSIKFKFMPSKIAGKEGVICLQLIHNREVKLQRTRFRLFSKEWDSQKETVIFGNVGTDRYSHLISVQIGLETERKQLDKLICLHEQKSVYKTVIFRVTLIHIH